MTSFAQRFRSLQRLPTSPVTSCAAVVTGPLAMEAKPLYQQQPSQQQQQQQLQLDNVTGLLSKLTEGQANLIAAISSSAARQPSSVMPPRRPGSSVRCFFCGELGHIVRNCDKRQRAQKCTLCNGWGHHPQNCANNFDSSQPRSDLRQQPDHINQHCDRLKSVLTDASDVGLGAVLTQLDDSGHERVISYASRTLTSREQNYTAMEKEALAVVFATEHFRVYLLGRQFQLITDNRALKWLHSLQAK
eukprot:gene16448-biopygen12123